MRKALVVLSGGQDSTICLWWAKENFNFVDAITFHYGQRHSREVEAAKRIAQMAGVHQTIIYLDKDILAGRSPLTNSKEKLETYQSPEEMERVIGERVELTYVPMRNSLFLTLAANRAICMADTRHIVTGVCQADNANYPDCRGSFIDAQQVTINEALGFRDRGCLYEAGLGPLMALGQESDSMFIHTPLMDTTKEDAILKCLDFTGCYTALAYSHTAYSGEYPPMTQDHATVLRADGFRKADIPDPLIVRAAWERLIPMPSGPGNENYDIVGPGPSAITPNGTDIMINLQMLEMRLREIMQ